MACQCHNPYLPQAAEILDIRRETAVDWTFRLDWPTDRVGPQPGQFFEVSLPGLGEAPISVCGFGPGYIEMTIRKVGKVTHGIFALSPGERLFLRGPYGHGFPLEAFGARNLVIVAGGTGLAPVRSVVRHFVNDPQQLKGLDILIGFKSPGDILFRQEIATWSSLAASGVRVQLTVDQAADGWSGHVGLITKLIPDVKLEDKGSAAAIVVGPPMMMKHSVAAVLALGLTAEQLWVSYERRMSCGVGKCGHCKINDKYVCLDGPVFNYSQAQWLKD